MLSVIRLNVVILGVVALFILRVFMQNVVMPSVVAPNTHMQPNGQSYTCLKCIQHPLTEELDAFTREPLLKGMTQYS